MGLSDAVTVGTGLSVGPGETVGDLDRDGARDGAGLLVGSLDWRRLGLEDGMVLEGRRVGDEVGTSMALSMGERFLSLLPSLSRPLRLRAVRMAQRHTPMAMRVAAMATPKQIFSRMVHG